MASIKDRVRDFSLANIQKTAQQLIQGAGYQSPDYLTDKTKVLARKAYVSPAPNRLKTNVQNLSQPLQTRILKPQAQEVKTNAFNQALASRGGQSAVQAVAGFSRGATTFARILPPVNKLSAKVESVTPEATTFDQKIARLGGAMAGGAANVMALGANPILTATSTGLGAVMGGASSALTDGDVSKGAYRGALRGAEDSPAYALTSAVVGKLAKGIGALKPLTDENITPIAGKTIRGVAGSAVKNLFARSARATLLETPYEALFYGIRDKEEKERLVDSITDEWWTNLVFNNAFAAVNTGQDVLSKQGREAVMQALENSRTYKQTLGNERGSFDVSAFIKKDPGLKALSDLLGRMPNNGEIQTYRHAAETLGLKPEEVARVIKEGKVPALDDLIEAKRVFSGAYEGIDPKSSPEVTALGLDITKSNDQILKDIDGMIKGMVGGESFRGSDTRIPLNRKQYNKHLRNAYKVATQQKGEAKIADLQKLVGGDNPNDVVLHNEAFREILRKHGDAPNFDFNSALKFVRTLNYPDSVHTIKGGQRVNFVRKISDDYANIVGVKPISAENKNYVNTSFLQGGAQRNKTLLEGPAVPSSPIGGGAVSALKSNQIIPQNDATGVSATGQKELPERPLVYQNDLGQETGAARIRTTQTKLQQEALGSANKKTSRVDITDKGNYSRGRAGEIFQPYTDNIPQFSVDPVTGRVDNRYVTEARTRIQEIDAEVGEARMALRTQKEIDADTRSRFDADDISLFNRIKRLSNNKQFASGDVETLRGSKYKTDIEDALTRVRETTNIIDDSEALSFIKDFPSKSVAPDGKIKVLLGEKRALQGFINDANKQSGTFVRVRTKSNDEATRALNDFKDWEMQVFKQEGAMTQGQLDKKAASDLAGIIKAKTKPAYIKDIEKLQDISDMGKGMTDVYRNFDHVFGEGSRVKQEILDPFDTSKARLVDDLDSWGNKLQLEVVDKLGIKMGSKESAAVQQYGEKLRDYDSLATEFGDTKAKSIVEADKWFRTQYDTLLNEVNAVRSKIYPDNPDKLIPHRQDYYRHFRDLSNTFAGLKNLFETSAGIDPSLAGVSEYVKPRSKWLSFAQQRLGMGTKYDAVGGFIDYVNAQSYAKNIDPHIGKFRALREELVNATSDRAQPEYGKLNNFIEFLDDYANDLAGKTNPADRALQKYIGRNPYRIINWINSRTKMNVILGNLSSAVAQFFNVPQGVAEAGVTNSTRGGARALASLLDDDPIMNKSEFIKTRYADNLNSKFDDSIVGDAKKAAGWITQIGDEIGTKFIWNSLYEKAVSDGVENPVKYADDITRKMVAGRGIGEVPLLQKSKTFQLVAPFQVEVGNVWHVMRDWAGEKEGKKLMTFFVASYLMNRAAKELRGSDVSFDPINAMIEAAQTMEKEDDKRRGVFLATGRLLGEVLSNVPLGQSIAASYPEYGGTIGDIKIPTREQFFGEGDPTRFGSGPLFLRGFTEVASGQFPYSLVPPFGGQQIKRTKEGLQAWMRGYDQSSSGKIRTPIDQTPLNFIKSATFGKYSTKNARDYFDNDRSVLGENQSETYRQLLETRGKEAADAYYDSIIQNRESSGTKVKGAADDLTAIEAMFRDSPDMLTAADIAKYYSKNLQKNPTTEYAKAQYAKDVWGQVSNINSRETLSDAQKRTASIKMLQKIGVGIEDYDYYSVAKQENALKSIYVRESLQGVQNRQELLERLVSMRKEVNGSMILAQGVVDELYNEGLITKAERDQLKNLKLDSDGNVVVKAKMTGRGGSAKLKRFKYVPMKAPKAKAIKLSKANQLSSPQKYQPIKVKMPEMRIPTPQVASDQKYQVKFSL